MTYICNETVFVKALADLRESVGWNRMENEYKNPLLTSYYHIAVYEKEALIGYIDCISNGVTDAYIQDLMVHPDYQGRGIGTDLMKKMIDYLKKTHIYMISVVFECIRRSPTAGGAVVNGRSAVLQRPGKNCSIMS